MATLNPALATSRPDSHSDSHSDSGTRLVAYWIFTLLGPASFVMGGTMMLTRNPEMMRNLESLGLPASIATILGIGKLAGAIVCVLPRLPLLKEWAYAGFGFLLAGASAMHALHGDGLAKILPPLMFLAFVGASYALRPAGRRLPHHAADREVA